MLCVLLSFIHSASVSAYGVSVSVPEINNPKINNPSFKELKSGREVRHIKIYNIKYKML